MSQAALMRGVPVALLSAVTTGTGTAYAVPTGLKNLTFTIKPAGTIATGAVQLEGSDNPSDANTWQPIGGGPLALATGVTQQYQFEGYFPFVRARVSTNVTGAGGTVTVNVVGA